jgi:hypothetical protein
MLVRVEELKKYFPVKKGLKEVLKKTRWVKAVDGVSFQIEKTLCEQRVPELKEVEEDHLVRCWKF